MISKETKFAALLAPVFLLAASPAISQDADTKDKPETTRLSVNGEGYVASSEARVENITVTGSSEIFDFEALKAVERNAVVLESLRTELAEKGIPRKDITTTQFRFERARNPDGIRRDREWGYRIRQDIQVTMTNADQAGPVIDALVTAGAENINLNNRYRGNSSQVISPEEQSKARKAAVEDARRKATDYAEAMGMRIVRVVSMRDGGVRVNSGGNRVIVTAALADGGSGTRIDPLRGDVIASVSINYELEPAN